MNKIVMIAALLSVAGSSAAFAANHRAGHVHHKPAAKEAPAKPAK
jgi:hypothetical protein